MFQFYCCKRDYIFHNLIKKTQPQIPNPHIPKTKRWRKKPKRNKQMTKLLYKKNTCDDHFILSYAKCYYFKIIIEVYIDKITVFELTS